MSSYMHGNISKNKLRHNDGVRQMESIVTVRGDHIEMNIIIFHENQ